MSFPRSDSCTECKTPFVRNSGPHVRCDECRRARNQRKARSPDARKKRNAQIAARLAVLRGGLKRLPCEWLSSDSVQCGRGKTHAHHEDYDRPLDVVWLCPMHHRWRHGMTADAPRWQLGPRFTCEAAA